MKIQGSAILAIALLAGCGRVPPLPSSTISYEVSAEGRVEGATRTHRLGFSRDGVVAQVAVSEGQRVEIGQLLASLDCREVEARVAAARGQVAVAEARQAELVAGGRADARAESIALLDVAEAYVEHTEADYRRAKSLYDDGILARAAMDAAVTQRTVAERTRDAAREKASQAASVPTVELRQVAEATTRAARLDVDVLDEQLRQCALRSPIRGAVVRTEVQPGESWTAVAGVAAIEVADLSSLRVRVELEDRDLSRVRIGQAVDVQSNSLGGMSVAGQVVSMSPRMGGKGIAARAPGDLVDDDVRDVLVALTPAVDLLPGQRVTVRFHH